MKVSALLFVMLTCASATGASGHNGVCAVSATLQRVAAKSLYATGHMGRKWRFDSQPAKFYLVSFVGLVPDTRATPSRSQVVAVASMQRQYSRFGLQTVLIDSSLIDSGRAATTSELENVWYDWDLDSVSLLSDRRRVLARTFGVCEAPSTFLITREGRVLERWNSFVHAGALALAIESNLNISLEAHRLLHLSPRQ